MGGYEFSIRNQLRESVQNVYCLVVFYDAEGSPIDVDAVQYRARIPAGLAKRVSSEVATSVKDMTRRGGRVEFRILDFLVSNQ
jgi:hypothetical protein